MSTVASSPIHYFFGNYEFDVARGSLRHEGNELPLRHQSLQLLLYLIEHPQTVISKDTLAEAIWGHTSVSDNALTQCITEIRRILNDDPHQPRFIKTVPKIGYRFIAEVGIVRDARKPVDSETELAGTQSGMKWQQTVIPSADAHSPAESPDFAPKRQGWRLIAMGMASVLLFLLSGDRGGMIARSSAATPLASATSTLLVFPLTNETGQPDMDWLREGLSDMMIADLSHTNKWNVLSREKTHDLLSDSNRSGMLTPDQSLAVARSVSATDYVVGTLFSAGTQTTISIEIRSGRDGHLLEADTASLNDPTQIVAEAGLLSSEIARLLGFPGGATRSLADVMTSNVDAYRYYSLGLEEAEQFQNAQAVELFQKALKIDPNFAMAYARIGYAYAVQDFRPEAARPYLEHALRLSGKLSALNQLYIEAWLAIARSDYNTAIVILQQITRQYPSETEATCQLSRLLRGQERLDEAAALLKNAIQVNPNAKDLYNAYGLILTSMKRPQEAIRAYQQYVVLAPRNPNGYDSLGMAYEMTGQYEPAVSEFNQALTLDPEFEPAIVHLGDTDYQMGRYRDALSNYHHYIQVTDSSDAKAVGYGDIATIYWTLGDLAQAQAAAGAEMHYNHSFVWPALAIALKMHQRDRAAQLEEQLFSNLPDAERGSPRDLRLDFFYRGYIDLKIGDAQGAISQFQSALEHLPPSSGIDSHEDCLADAYLELGMNREAIAEYQRILGLNPNYPLAYFHLGQAYLNLHDRQDAAAAFHHFLDANPTADQDSPQVIEARRELQ